METVTSEYIAQEVAISLAKELNNPSIREQVTSELIRKEYGDFRGGISEESLEVALVVTIAGAIIQVASFTIQVLDYMKKNRSEDKTSTKLEIKRKIDISIIQKVDSETLDKIIDYSITIAESKIYKEK